MLTLMLEIALGPMLWILFGASLLGTIISIIVSVTKRGWGFALAGAALPLIVAGLGAGVTLLELSKAVAEEGNGLAVVAPSLGRALMLSMLGFAATLAPAIPAILGAPKNVASRWPLVPLSLIPLLAIVQIPFGYPATSLIRLIPYLGIAGALAKRRATYSLLLPVVAAGEAAAIAVAHVTLFSSLALSGAAGADIVSASAREIAAGRWFGIAALAMVVLAQALGRRWISMTVLSPICLGAAWLADATERILTLVR